MNKTGIMPVVEAVERLAMSSEPDKPPEFEGLPPWMPERRTPMQIRARVEGLGQFGRKLKINLHSNLAAYNPTAPLVLRQREFISVAGKELMLARMDIPDKIVSSIVTVCERRIDEWDPLEEVEPFQNAEDAYWKLINGKPMLTFVKVINPEQARMGKRVRFHQEFHTTDDMRHFELFAIGPENMKDIRFGQRDGSRGVEGFNRLQRQEMDPPPEVDELVDYFKFFRNPNDPLIEARLKQWDSSRVAQIKQVAGSGVILNPQPGALVDLIVSKLNYLSNLDDGTRESRERVNNVLKLIGDARQSRDLDQFIKDHEVVVLYEQGGLGKIGYINLPSADHLKDPRNIIHGRTLEGLLPEGSWGGVGDFWFEGDRLDVGGHNANEDRDKLGKWRKHYYDIGFVYDPRYHIWPPIEALASRTNFPEGPSKVTDPTQPGLNDDIAFLSGMRKAKEPGKLEVYVGYGDANAGVAVTDNPFPGQHRLLDEWINRSSKPLLAQAV